MGKSAIRPKIEILHLSTVSDGRQLELNTRFDGMSHPLATIVAEDADESLWLEMYVGDQPVQTLSNSSARRLHLPKSMCTPRLGTSSRAPMSQATVSQHER